jgi:hypothetical protein
MNFIRPKHKRGERTYYSLVQNYRTKRGNVRQRHLASLFHFPTAEKAHKNFSGLLEAYEKLDGPFFNKTKERLRRALAAIERYMRQKGTGR